MRETPHVDGKEEKKGIFLGNEELACARLITGTQRTQERRKTMPNSVTSDSRTLEEKAKKKES